MQPVSRKSSAKRKRVSSMTTTLKLRYKTILFIDKSNGGNQLPLLNKALYSKYSSSQNYYYSRDITDILLNESTAPVVIYRDLEVYVEEEEYLKRVYRSNELPAKQSSLLEYYKYHIDIPRLYQRHICRTIFHFHDKKRRIEYAHIKHVLGLKDEGEAEPMLQKTPPKTELKNVLAPLHSFLQKTHTSFLRQRPTQESLSILTIVQNMPKMEQMNFYMDSFDDLDLQLRELSRVFMRPPPKQLMPKSIPQKFMQQIIQQQKKKQQALTYQTPNPSEARGLNKPKIKPIDINFISKRDVRSPQTSKRTPISTRRSQDTPKEIKVQLPLPQKSRRTNSNYIPSQVPLKTSLKLNNLTQLSSPPKLGAQTTREVVRNTEIQKFMQSALKAYQKPKPVAQQPTRTKSIDQLSPMQSNVYVNGCHKKVPSMYALNQHNLVNIFMEELKQTLRQGTPLQSQRSSQTCKISRSTMDSTRKHFKK